MKIFDRHIEHGKSNRNALLLTLLSVAGLMVWALWPLRVTLEGKGMIQPRFENLIRITPGESGMVCRVLKEKFQEVQAGEPLFEYIPAGKYSVMSYSRMTPPGGGEVEPEPIPDWYQKVEHERIARIGAANRWSGRVLSQVKNALKWESDLASRLSRTVPLEADLMREQAQQRENIRLGHENANKVYTFNESIGESVPTEQGVPLTSPITGNLFSLWVQPQTQIFGSTASTLPQPLPGDPPRVALHFAGSYPVGEIMPPGTPLEVLALMPIPPKLLHWHKGWQASIAIEAQEIKIPAESNKIEIGRVSLSSDDSRLVVPEISSSQESVFARLSLAGGPPRKIGTMVQVRLVSPSQPRVWYWLK